MFDRVEIMAKAGNGGDGAISFRREKYVPFGGPDGGDGGAGGSIIIEASASVDSLRAFKQKRLFRAGDGKPGAGQKKHGRAGEDVIISVPSGTVIFPKTQIGGDMIIADLESPGQRTVVARGGRGGLGNVHFASSTNQTPQIAQKGDPGEECGLVLELKLIADIGIIGYPNVGKSTLITAVSAAHPKIAPYPFTTLEPVLGVAEVDGRSVVLAEIPGLVNEAHLGRGLGHEFLRHITRTRVLIHLVDGGSESPVEDMVRVNAELGLFDSELGKKPQLVAVNKVDLPEVESRRAEIGKAFKHVGISPLFIAAASGEGVPALLEGAVAMLAQVDTRREREERVVLKVFHPQPRESGVKISRDGDIFVINAPELERITARVDIRRAAVYSQVRREIDRLGITQALSKAGAKPGDKVRCGDQKWDWY